MVIFFFLGLCNRPEPLFTRLNSPPCRKMGKGQLAWRGSMESYSSYDLEESACKKEMSPRKISRTILIILLFFLIALAILVFVGWPRYPSFEKKLESFGELEAALSDEENLILPDLDFLEYENVQYYLRLNGRDLLSKAIGYYVYGNSALLGKEIDLSVVAEPEMEGNHNNYDDLQYRGVGIRVLESSSSSDHWIEQEFRLEGFEYHLYSSFSLKDLDLEEVSSMGPSLEKSKLY